MSTRAPAHVVAVAAGPDHVFSKPSAGRIELVEGLGVRGDAHFGRTVQHLSRIARDPSQVNLRQVHLIHAELFDELVEKGFEIVPGELGENVTTRGLDLLGLSPGTRLRLGPHATVEITGLRNPCKQIEELKSGLLAATLEREPSGGLVRKAGVMGIVIQGGDVSEGDAIEVEKPPGRHVPLEVV